MLYVQQPTTPHQNQKIRDIQSFKTLFITKMVDEISNKTTQNRASSPASAK